MVRLKPDRQKPGALVVAEHHVHVLNGLTCSALHEVVEDSHEQNAAAGGVYAPADVTEIRDMPRA